MELKLDHSFKHKKKFGQHFLHDTNIAAGIVSALTEKLQTTDVLEIGPGEGILTQFLLNKNFNLHISEIDADVPVLLEKKFPGIGEKIILDDFLRLDLEKIFPGEFSIIGNFPYNISSQILFKTLAVKHKVPLLVGMFQKEVAQRIASGPGNKDYGILSVLCQAWYKVDYLFTVPEHVFTPPPKVKSGVLRMERLGTGPDCPEDAFYKIVKTGFNQRRKTLRNALKSLLSQPDSQHPLLSQRAEQLSVEEFAALTRWIQTLSKV